VNESDLIEIEYDATPAECREAISALARPRWPIGRPLPLPGHLHTALGWALFVGCGFLLYMLKRSEGSDLAVVARDAVFRHPIASSMAVIGAVSLGAVGFRLKKAADVQLASYRSRFKFDVGGVTEDTPLSRINHPWSSFSAWVETEHLLVLRIRGAAQGRPMGLYFAKRLFASEQSIYRLKAFLSEHIHGPVG
jgi:hypothetical protein